MAGFNQIISSNPNNPMIIDAVNLANQTSDTVRNLSISSHQIGDMILVMTGNRTATAPDLLSGYTDILSVNNSNNRSLRLQYKFATSSTESISWTGAYGYIAAIRNACNIGQFNTLVGGIEIESRWPIPGLYNLNTSASKLIIAGTYVTGTAYGSPTTPYIGFNSSNLNSPCFVYVNKNIGSVLTVKTCANASLVRSHYAVEIL